MTGSPGLLLCQKKTKQTTNNTAGFRVNGVIEDVDDHGKLAQTQEVVLEMQPEELSDIKHNYK